jgi:hypothetical protein
LVFISGLRCATVRRTMIWASDWFDKVKSMSVVDDEMRGLTVGLRHCWHSADKTSRNDGWQISRRPLNFINRDSTTELYQVQFFPRGWARHIWRDYMIGLLYASQRPRQPDTQAIPSKNARHVITLHQLELW